MDFADEFIIIDGGSTDGTIDKVLSYKSDKVKIVERPWDNHFGKQWEFGMQYVTGDWVFIWGSDEACSIEASKNVRSFIKRLDKRVKNIRFGILDLIKDENHILRGGWDNVGGILWHPHLFKTESFKCSEDANGFEIPVWNRYESIVWACYVKIHYKLLSERRYRRKVDERFRSMIWEDLIRLGAVRFCPGRSIEVESGLTSFDELVSEIPECIKWNKLSEEDLNNLRCTL
jgi:glycosyltransferase involved in cell wall biosynthesis